MVARRVFPATLLICAAGLLALACGPGYTDQEIASGADRLRDLYDHRDYERGMIEGERWRDAGPRAFEPRAWYVLNTARFTSDDALSDSTVAWGEAMVAQDSANPWAWFALAGALNYHRDRSKEALAASDSGLRRSTSLDMLRLRAEIVRSQVSDSAGLAFIDSLPPEIQATPIMLVRRGVAEYYRADAVRNDSLRNAAFATFARARQAEPTNVEAYYLPGAYLGRFPEALPLLERAAQLTTALDVHQYYWRAAQSRTDLAVDATRSLIHADADSLLAHRGDLPSTSQVVASIYGEIGLTDDQRVIEERVLRESPNSAAAEWVLVGRYRELGREIYDEKQLSGKTDPAKQARYREMLEAYIARPRHSNKRLLGNTYMSLFAMMGQFVQDDSVIDGDYLYGLVQGMRTYETSNAHMVYGAAAVTLANAKTHLDAALRIAREGIAEAKKTIDEQNERGVFETEGDYQQAVGWYTGIMYDALGWVYFAQGQFDAAEDTLLYAHELDPKSVVNLQHLGTLYERRADIAGDSKDSDAATQRDRYLDEAQEYYIKGAMMQRPGDNPTDAALRQLYARRHGSLDGWDTFRASIEDIDRTRRRKEVLAERITEPKPMPHFALASLRGHTVTSQQLRGKVVVINYWGIWCGPCVAEMPEFQRFHERYRNDPGVVVLTIDNDTDPNDVRQWMTKHQFDFQVLWDDGYVDKANVHAFPTTWFVDPQGRIVFSKTGWSESLTEEFAWRAEALRGN